MGEKRDCYAVQASKHSKNMEGYFIIGSWYYENNISHETLCIVTNSKYCDHKESVTYRVRRIPPKHDIIHSQHCGT